MRAVFDVNLPMMVLVCLVISFFVGLSLARLRWYVSEHLKHLHNFAAPQRRSFLVSSPAAIFLGHHSFILELRDDENAANTKK